MDEDTAIAAIGIGGGISLALLGVSFFIKVVSDIIFTALGVI